MKGDNLFCDVELEFAGGLDTLTVNQRKRYKLRILTTELTVSQLVAYVRKTAFAGRKDMFSEPPEVISSDCQQVEVQGDLPGQLTLSERSRVRPGVLVLVDDVDWELLGSGDCIIKGSKSISFISSLHGDKDEIELGTLEEEAHWRGPVPLLRNPVKRWLHLLIFLHLFLLILTCIAISFPFIYDLHCSILFNSLANIIASSVGSFVLAAYYTGIAAKDWGTEVEWTLTTLITATMVVVDIAVSAWGIYALSNASVKIYQALHNALELEPECLQTKAAIFYFAAFAVIFAHLIVAGMCAVVSVLLGKGIKRQLLEIRDIY